MITNRFLDAELSINFQAGNHLQALADVLHTCPSKIQSHYKSSTPAVFNGTIPIRLEGDDTGLVYTIIALEDLALSNGLPALGDREETLDLKEGEALHFDGKVRRIFRGYGGSLLLIYWYSRSSLSGGKF